MHWKLNNFHLFPERSGWKSKHSNFQKNIDFIWLSWERMMWKKILIGTRVFANVQYYIFLAHKMQVRDDLDWFHLVWHFYRTTFQQQKHQIECLRLMVYVRFVNLFGNYIQPSPNKKHLTKRNSYHSVPAIQLQFIVYHFIVSYIYFFFSCTWLEHLYRIEEKTIKSKIWQNACLHAYFPSVECEWTVNPLTHT